MSVVLPADDALRTDVEEPRKVLKGLDAVVNGGIGWWKRRSGFGARELERVAETAEGVMEGLSGEGDARVEAMLWDLRVEVRCGAGEVEEGMLLGVLGEAARRRLHLKPYRVQLMAAAALRGGYLAEMATGEGKTLAVALAAVASGWRREPCHVITANDYLARRDAKTLEGFYKFCGVTVGAVTGGTEQGERREVYECDVVYTTAKELTADYLRDRLRLGDLADSERRTVRRLRQAKRRAVPEMVTRGIKAALVDEADSLLVDEAVTPLLISQAREDEAMEAATVRAGEVAVELREGRDYTVDYEWKSVALKDGADDEVERGATGLPGAFSSRHWFRPLVEQALQARLFFLRERQYVVKERKVVIVDEYTGRLMPGRTWKGGLHQAVEAKEGLPITAPTATLARVSFQRFFRLFGSLGAITGTAREAAGEFWQMYGLPFVVVPPNRPCVREQLPDVVFAEEDEKWDAVVREIVWLHEKRRPVLVGTRSVEASEMLAERLRGEKLSFRLLNAVRSNEEAVIISAAGREGAITIATNMAGRGTDIVLGDGVAGNGGLHVIATERHDAGRIDRQLFGRAGRQGDAGSARAYLSLADEVVVRYAPGWLAWFTEGYFGRALPGGRRLALWAMHSGQRRSERKAVRLRRAVAQQDEWLDDALGSGSGSGGGGYSI